MDEMAARLLSEHGLDGGAHRARQISPAMLRESDLILCMERNHLAALGRTAPEVAGKMFLLDKWIDARDIPDPYRQRRPAFEHVYMLIDQAVHSWLPYL